MSSLFLFITIFITYLLPAQDADLGWHMRFGQYFINHGQPLLKNTLTVLLHNQPWPNSYTLYQPLIAFSFRHLGFWGLSIITSLLITSSFFIIWLLFDKDTTKTTFTALITTIGGWLTFRYGLRGQITAPFFLSLLFYILKKVKKPLLHSISLFTLFVFWSNFHGTYFYGLLLVGLYYFLQITTSLIYKKRPPWLLTFSSIPAFFAPIINPHKLQNYTHVFITVLSPLDKMIAEWTPPPLSFKLIIIFFFVTYLIIFFQKPTQNIKKQLFWATATLSAFYLSISARRNLPIFFLIQSLSLSQLISLKKAKSLIHFTLIAGFIASLTFILPHTISYNSSPQNYCHQGEVAHPCQAIDYIKDNHLSGRIFNLYRWGGYLTWQLPDSLPFIAGHIPDRPHPSDQYPYQIHLEIIQAQPGYQKLLDQYQIDYLLIPPGTFLDLELKNNPQAPWQPIYQDKTAILYQKKS